MSSEASPSQSPPLQFFKKASEVWVGWAERRRVLVTVSLIASAAVAGYFVSRYQSEDDYDEVVSSHRHSLTVIETEHLTDLQLFADSMGGTCSSTDEDDLSDPLLSAGRRSVGRTREIGTQTHVVVESGRDLFCHSYDSKRKSVLMAIRNGDLHCRLETIDEESLRYYLPLVCALICRVPFEMSELKSTLLRQLKARLRQSVALQQSFEFFLASFGHHHNVVEVFNDELLRWRKKMKRYADFYEQTTLDKTKDSRGASFLKKPSYIVGDGDSDEEDMSTSLLEQKRRGSTPAVGSKRKGSKFRKLFSRKVVTPEPMPVLIQDESVSAPVIRSGTLPLEARYESLAGASTQSPSLAGESSSARRDTLDSATTADSTSSPSRHSRQRSHSTGDLMAMAMFEAPNIVIEDRCITISMQNAIEFYYAIFRVAPMPGFRVVMDSGSGKGAAEVFHPWDGAHCVAQLQVRKVFSSNAKPVLMDCFVREKRLLAEGSTDEAKQKEVGDLSLSPYALILKQGDDLRKDAAVLQMFEFMNILWREGERSLLYVCGKPCLAQTYKCTPMSVDFGCIELISGCQTLKKIKGLAKTFAADESKMANLLTTAAGSYIASYVMGIRDRHYDNVLIRDDGLLFHIDFGYALGETLGGLDAASIAITSEMRAAMADHWEDFCVLCAEAFVHLRRHYAELLSFAKLVFAFIFDQSQIESFLHGKLRMLEREEVVHKQIAEKIRKAPSAFKTKFKNRMHAIAQMT